MPGRRRTDSEAPYGSPATATAPTFIKFYFAMVGQLLDGLSLSRQFTLESGARAIDACDDPAELRRIAKMLLSAWQLQSDLTRHYGAQTLGMPSKP